MNSLGRRFPALLALAALLIYVVTLSRGVTVDNLGLVGKINGWDYQPWVGHPLLWFFTVPLRVLPESWVPWLLDLFSAVCAAATLGILARSVQLTPWFDPSLASSEWRERLPVVVGVIVCGMELNFWQNATAATGEMLEVLLLASAIWSLLEFRESRDDRWLYASVAVWGLGMAENWMMMLTLPLFVISTFVLQPLRFLQQPRLVLRLAGLGLAGFSIYGLLPVLNGLAPSSPWNLGHSWLASLRHTRQTLWLVFSLCRNGSVGVLVLVFYLLPALACFACAYDKPRAKNPLLDQAQIWLFRACRAALLVASFWLALNPVIGPRGILKHEQYAFPLLSFDLLNGLAAGILAGNLLQLGQKKSRSLYLSDTGKSLFLLQQRGAVPLVVGGGMLTVSLLLARNVSQVTLVNRVPLVEFGDLALRSLPSGGGILFSDFSDRLNVFQAAQAASKASSRWVPVDAGAFSKEYLAWFGRRHPRLGAPGANFTNPTIDDLRQWMQDLITSNRVYYLHPSLGYFFESFYQVPVGSVHELKLFPTNGVGSPELPRDLIEVNESLWDGAERQIELLKMAGQENISGPGFLEKKLRLEPWAFEQGTRLRGWYSMALDSWGVELQRAGRLPQAQKRFVQAIELNTNNWIARANLFCNQNLQAGVRMNLAGLGKLAQVADIRLSLAQDGPVDEPTLCYAMGLTNMQARLPRQAMQQLERAAALASSDVTAPQFALATLYLQAQLPDRARAAISRLRDAVRSLPATNPVRTEVSFLEADFQFSQTNLAEANRILNDIAREHAEDTDTLARVVQKFIGMRDFTNADAVVTGRLAQTPDDPFLLQLKSGLLMESGHAEQAIPVLNHLLSVTNSPQAKFGRGIAYLRVKNYAAAQEDFLSLKNSAFDPYEVNFGLAETSLGRGDTNEAVRYLNECLSQVQTNSVRWKRAAVRLKGLGRF
jgi:tetratricopeptide (TPR) repeat protein